MKGAIRAGKAKDPWRDRWVRHPHTSMIEPEKEIAPLTPIHADADGVADRYLSASLHAVSRYFMQVRRMLSMFERPIRSGHRELERQTYSGYAPYNPRVAQQVLNVFCGYYNYCKPGADGKTPAMRLGLADRCYSVAEVLGVKGAPFPTPPGLPESTVDAPGAAPGAQAWEEDEEAAEPPGGFSPGM